MGSFPDRFNRYMRVAIYCRVSTSDQNCDRQERDLTDFASRASWNVIGIWKETASGAKCDRAARALILNLARTRQIDAVLVTELTRWGRSTIDLIETMQSLAAWGVSLIAQTGFQLDLTTPQGKLIATILASVAEFERDLIRDRVRSGIAAAKARGKKIGRQPGQRPKSDKLLPKIVAMRGEGASIRAIAASLNCSTATVQAALKRAV
jgi:putative DNA-invertase from lambdoid prophage Rac